MIKYRRTITDDANSLKELWVWAFQEKPQAVDMFFQNYNSYTAFVAEEKGSIVSMLFFLDTMIDGRKAGYLYAAATSEKYRCRGIMRSLIDFAINNSNYELFVTLPAEKTLYSFYEKLGFKAATSTFANLSNEEMEYFAKAYEPQELIVKNYCGIRNSVLKENFLFWNNNHINYAFDYADLYGGKVIKNNFGYAVIFTENGICEVSEIICHKDNLPFMLYDIINTAGADSYSLHLPSNIEFDDLTTMEYGMVKSLNGDIPNNIYFGLTLE